MFGFRFGKRLAKADKSYDFPPYRPPNEADSLLLRLTHGCPWNRCAFCPMYRDVPFAVRSVDAILEDIQTARAFYGEQVETVFIGDSNSLIMETASFCQVLDALYEAFPTITRVTSYARAATLKKKTPENLDRLRKAGLTRLHLGLESGSSVLLKMFKKGATPETMIAGCSKAKDAGFEVSLYVLAGMGGEKMWEEHAADTAAVLNRINPHFIRVRTLTPQPQTPLFQWVEAGDFHVTSPETILKEQARLIQGLDVTSMYLSDHITNYASINGQLPQDKEDMIATVEETLDRIETDESYREALENIRNLRRL